jgi:hypothetical protein
MTVHVAMMYGEGSLRRMCSLSVLTDSFLLGVKVMDIFSVLKHLLPLHSDPDTRWKE